MWLLERRPGLDHEIREGVNPTIFSLPITTLIYKMYQKAVWSLPRCVFHYQTTTTMLNSDWYIDVDYWYVIKSTQRGVELVAQLIRASLQTGVVRTAPSRVPSCPFIFISMIFALYCMSLFSYSVYQLPATVNIDGDGQDTDEKLSHLLRKKNQQHKICFVSQLLRL